jgi:hypothetical protein
LVFSSLSSFAKAGAARAMRAAIAKRTFMVVDYFGWVVIRF